jgi:ActR/RegA family two-component response regulator
MVPHIVVIDDDPLFLQIMTRLGSERGIPITTCRSLEELSVLVIPNAFDVAVIDFYLDGVKDRLKGTDLVSLLKDTPVVLVSNHEEVSDGTWPNAVKGFVNKEHGPHAILAAALLEGRARQLRALI